MAEIQNTGGSRKGLKARAKIPAPRIDMTPMVDLAFLLLTFFVLTATFNQPKSLELVFPPPGEPSPLKKGITFLLSKDDRIFYYEGELRATSDKEGTKTQLAELSFSEKEQNSLHLFLMEKNKVLHEQIRSLSQQHHEQKLDEESFKQQVRERKADKNAYTFIVKTDENATYKNVIDVIDELNINVVGKYAVTDIAEPELALLNETMGSNTNR